MVAIPGKYIDEGTIACKQEEAVLHAIQGDVVIIDKAAWDNHLEFLREIREWMTANDYECGSWGATIYERLTPYDRSH